MIFDSLESDRVRFMFVIDSMEDEETIPCFQL